jgi:hypothetical protein
MGTFIVSISNTMQRYTVYLYLETAIHVLGGISTHHQERINCIYSIWYLSHRYWYLPLSWKSWDRFECAVDDVCAPDDVWKYHPKHVEQFSDINKLCDVASCWIYEYIGILLRARPILHISRIKVNVLPMTDKHILSCITALIVLRHAPNYTHSHMWNVPY